MPPKLIHHVHFGPGKLGLGFVVPTIKEMAVGSSVQTVLATRYADPKSRPGERNETIRNQQEYGLVVKEGANTNVERIRDIELVYTDGDRESLLKFLALPETMLVTTSVTGRGISDVKILLAEGLRRRSQNQDATNLIVIACENPPLNSRQLEIQVRQELSDDAEDCLRRVGFLNAIVDRVCPTECRLEDGTAIVETEKFRQWIVLKDDLDALKIVDDHPFLTSPIEVISSSEEFEFLEKRKRWLVNGTHVAAAFFARSIGVNSLPLALEDEYVLKNVQSVQDGCAQALFINAASSTTAAYNDIREFGRRVIDRIKNGPEDTADRILMDWINWPGDPPQAEDGGLVLSELAGLLNKSVLRSIEPIEELLQADALVKYPEIASAVTQLLIHKIRYLQSQAARCD